jgi:hypothetical protein
VQSSRAWTPSACSSSRLTQGGQLSSDGPCLRQAVVCLGPSPGGTARGATNLVTMPGPAASAGGNLSGVEVPCP